MGKVLWNDLNERQRTYMKIIFHTDHLQIHLEVTKEGRKLVRSATDAEREIPLPSGTLREWHWRALAEAWKSRPEGVKASGGWYGDYGHIGWNTWLRLKQYKDGALIEEYQTWGQYLPSSGYTPQISWLRLTPFGKQYSRDNWQRSHEMYPDVDAPHAEKQTAESESPTWRKILYSS